MGPLPVAIAFPSFSLDAMHPKRQANLNARRPTLRNREMDALIRLAWDTDWWCERGVATT